MASVAAEFLKGILRLAFKLYYMYWKEKKDSQNVVTTITFIHYFQ